MCILAVYFDFVHHVELNTELLYELQYFIIRPTLLTTKLIAWISKYFQSLGMQLLVKGTQPTIVLDSPSSGARYVDIETDFAFELCIVNDVSFDILAILIMECSMRLCVFALPMSAPGKQVFHQLNGSGHDAGINNNTQ